MFVHGGPFANIAHGCNTLLATRMAMHHADWAITEAGFGFDLGAEKFLDIKCRTGGLDPDAIVLVTTVRALKSHGGKGHDELEQPDEAAVRAGLPNLDKHLESAGVFGKKPVVALNRFAADTDEEIAVIRDHVQGAGYRFAESRHFSEGGPGSADLAREVMASVADNGPLRFSYAADDPFEEKVRKVARSIYGARDVIFSKEAEKDFEGIRNAGLGRPADLYCQDPRIPLGRSEAAGTSKGLRHHGSQRPGQRRRRLPGGTDRQYPAYARSAQIAAGAAGQAEPGRERGRRRLTPALAKGAAAPGRGRSLHPGISWCRRFPSML